MTLITSAANGNASTPGSWVGGVVPGVNDTVIIAHDVILDTSMTWGNSPVAGTTVLTVQTGKSLSFSPSAVLSLRGGFLLQGSARLIFAGLSGLEFDPSNAASPSTAAYIGKIGSAHNSTPALVFNGTLGSPCFIRTKAGAATAAQAQLTDGDGPYIQAGLMQGTFCNFSRLGDASRPAFLVSPGNAGAFSLTDCNIDACGQIAQTYNIDTAAIYELIRCNFTNSLATVNLQLTAVNAITGAGSRKIYNCSFDKTLHFYPPKLFDIQGNYFNLAFDTTDGDWTQFKNNFVRMTSAIGLVNDAGGADANYIFYDEPTEFNPHFWNVLSHGRSTSIVRNIFDMNCNALGQEGDCITLSAAGSTDCVATIKNNLIVRGPSNKTVGTLFTALGSAHTSVICEHNTCFTGSQGAAVGETYAGFNGMVQSFKSNLMVSKNGGEGLKLYDSGSNDSVTDLVSSVNADYNAGFGLLAGSNLKGYDHLEFASGSPGAHDIDGDPLFVDDSRNLATWSTYKGGPGTVADAMVRIKANTSLVLDLIAWVNAGHYVQKSALNNAGHDGVTIGALPFLSATSISASPTSVVADSTGNIITLTGVGTSWTPGTPGTPTFSVSGVTGVVKTAQVVNNGTSATLTLTASSGGNTGTITISDGAGHTTDITVVANGFSPVPQEATYWAMLREFAGYKNTWYLNNNHPAVDAGLSQTYYDGEMCMYRLKDHFGTSEFDNLINEEWLAYVGYYVIPNNGAITGWRNFTDGQREDCLRATSRATISLNSITLQQQYAAFNSQPVDMSDPVLSRETALAITAKINAKRVGISIGAAQQARLLQLKAWAIGHCNQWSGGTAPYVRPFMVGHTAKALIYYYEYESADSDIIVALKAVADYCWTNCWKDVAGAWGDGQAFLYTNNTSQGDPQDPFTQPTLNMMICPLFGWLFYKGQGAGYRTKGDAIFVGGIPVYDQYGSHVSGSYLGTRSAANPAGKEIDQQLFWGPDYIRYATASQTSSMTVSPISLVANSLNNIVTVTGVGTAWTPGTPGTPHFSLSGVSGAQITNQVINSPTSATLTVQASAGGATGSLLVSDGSIVSSPISITPLPNSGGANGRRRPY